MEKNELKTQLLKEADTLNKLCQEARKQGLIMSAHMIWEASNELKLAEMYIDENPD